VLDRSAWRPAVETKKQKLNGHNRYQLSVEKYRELVRATVKVACKCEPTAFAVEGPARRILRAIFCLWGWPWWVADAWAAAIIRSALRRVHARRPSWAEGQREYCSNGYLRDDLCWQCGDALPLFAKKFCSPECSMKFPRLVSPRWPEPRSHEYEKFLQSLKQKRRQSRRRSKIKRAEAVLSAP
jgi:hypothetical protein